MISLASAMDRPRSDLVSDRSRLIDLMSILVSAAPFWVAAAALLATDRLVLGGDQALIGLDALDARQLEQGVGPYSRMGWAHPGPAWLYLLAPLWWVFGSTGQALVAASLILHGVAAALVVVAAGGQRVWHRPLAAVVVLAYVVRMPAVDLVSVWNPFALLLPMMLLLLLAARAWSGGLAAVVLTALLASMVLQTHIGTVPIVGLVALLTALVVVVRIGRGTFARPTSREWVLTGAATVGLFLIWAPVVLQQVFPPAPGRGNVSLILAYVRADSTETEQGHDWVEAVSATGQLLGAPVYGWLAEPRVLDTAVTSPAVIYALLVTALGGLAVAVLGWRWREVVAAGAGAAVTVACVAALISARAVTGEMYNYLLLWVTVLPAVLLLAGVTVLLSRLRGRRPRVAVAGLLALFALALGVRAGVDLRDAGVDRLPDQPGAAQVADLATRALPAAGAGDPPVFLDITDVSMWTTATSVALELALAGYDVSVAPEWVYSFGEDRRSRGDERWRLALVGVDANQPSLPGQLGLVATSGGPTAVVLEPAR